MNSEPFSFETRIYIISGLILLWGAGKIVRTLKSSYLPEKLKTQSLINGILFCLSGFLGILSIYLNQNYGPSFFNFTGIVEFFAAILFFIVAVFHYIYVWCEIKALPAGTNLSDHNQTGTDKQSVLSQMQKEWKSDIKRGIFMAFFMAIGGFIGWYVGMSGSEKEVQYSYDMAYLQQVCRDLEYTKEALEYYGCPLTGEENLQNLVEDPEYNLDYIISDLEKYTYTDTPKSGYMYTVFSDHSDYPQALASPGVAGICNKLTLLKESIEKNQMMAEDYQFLNHLYEACSSLLSEMTSEDSRGRKQNGYLYIDGKEYYIQHMALDLYMDKVEEMERICLGAEYDHYVD